jgi:hypothetical protein
MTCIFLAKLRNCKCCPAGCKFKVHVLAGGLSQMEEGHVCTKLWICELMRWRLQLLQGQELWLRML